MHALCGPIIAVPCKCKVKVVSGAVGTTGNIPLPSPESMLLHVTALHYVNNFHYS